MYSSKYVDYLDEKRIESAFYNPKSKLKTWVGINCRNPETPYSQAFPGLSYCRGIKMALPHEIVRFLDGLIGGGGVQVAVCPECGLDIFMAQFLTCQQHRRSQPDQQGGVGMPLRHNNDKRKKPIFSKGLSVCRHLFNSFSKLKSGEKNIEKKWLFH